MGFASRLAAWWSLRREGVIRSQNSYGREDRCIVIDDPDTMIMGCGWFNSSHDLRAGLAVFEGEAAELNLAVERMLRSERANA